MNRLVLLGPIEITTDGAAVRGFESRKALALLCYLALRAQPVSRAELANLFWPEKTETQGRGNLSRVLHNLGTLFPETMIADRETIRTKPDAFSLDFAEFETLRAQRTPAGLSAAANLYRGECMQGLYLDDCPDFELWLVEERERWRQRGVSVLECLSGYYARRAEYTLALAFAARLLDIEPWREEAHRQMMQLLAQTGQRSAALQQYETARRVLAEELNVEPSIETEALYGQIRTEEIAPSAAPPHNLPTQLTTFFGRDTDLTRIAARLNNPDCRLLTLVGAGGIGKTRLALEAAKHLLGSFRDGVYFVPLASIGAGQIEFIAPAIANAFNLSLTGQQEPKTQVLDFLRDKQILLLLDNLEHLLDGAELVITILLHAPRVKILATSREPLNVQAEWLTRVDGLNFPITAAHKLDELLAFSATRLFVERAQRVSDNFEFSPETAPHILRLAQIVEGTPLALELAAARTRTMRVNEIRAQVEASFDFLATTMRDVDARHKSLRAVLDWSYAYLAEGEQHLFACVSVFAGGWTLDAAVAVCAGEGVLANEVPSLLNQLADKSLVLKEEYTGETRYRMLEPNRHYAGERLQDQQKLRLISQRHSYFFLALAEEVEPKLAGAEQSHWLDYLEREHDNLRAAVRYSLQALDTESALRIAGALRRFWFFHGHWNEGRKWLQEGLARRKDVSDRTRARAVFAAGFLALVQNDYQGGVPLLEESLLLFRKLSDKQNMAESLHNLGMAALDQGNFERGDKLVRESLSLREEIDDKRGIAYSRSMLGQSAIAQGRYYEARQHLAESLVFLRELGDKWGITLQLIELGRVAAYQADHEETTVLLQESLVLGRELGDKRMMARSLIFLAHASRNQGNHNVGQAQSMQALSLLAQIGDKESVVMSLQGLAATLIELDQPTKAAILISSIDALRKTHSIPIPPTDRPDYDRVLARVRELLQDKFQWAWDKGVAMTLDQAIDYALQNGENDSPLPIPSRRG